MIKERGFDSEKYLRIQTQAILQRVSKFNKLYLEVGGKLYGDYHAARVLPGYDPDIKIKILNAIKNQIEIVFCVSARDIEESKIRGDLGLTYEAATIRAINDLESYGLNISAVIINRFSGEKRALKLKRYLENLGISVYLQKEIEGYPADVNKIVSEEGFGQNPYINTNKEIVIVTGAGPGSGKMSFCLSQMYFDHKNGIKSGFAKLETFPIYNLPLEHPVNLAYEAATADIGDINMIDPFHLKEYNVIAVNYNRDIENFSILRKILEKIEFFDYKSPTDMGVNKVYEGIIDNRIIESAAKDEIIRRYFRYKKERALGLVDQKAVDTIEKLMQKLNLNETDRKVVLYAREAIKEGKSKNKGHKGFYCGSAIEINDKIITGKNSSLLHSESACILNALKFLANIPDEIHILPESLINNIKELKRQVHNNSNHFNNSAPSLDVSEVLIALASSAISNPLALQCIHKVPLLKNCEMHTTHLPTKGDEAGLRELGINLTTDAEFTPTLFVHE